VQRILGILLKKASIAASLTHVDTIGTALKAKYIIKEKELHHKIKIRANRGKDEANV